MSGWRDKQYGQEWVSERSSKVEMKMKNEIERRIEMRFQDGRYLLTGYIRTNSIGGWDGVSIPTDGTKTETFREAKEWFCHSDVTVLRKVKGE